MHYAENFELIFSRLRRHLNVRFSPLAVQKWTYNQIGWKSPWELRKEPRIQNEFVEGSIIFVFSTKSIHCTLNTLYRRPPPPPILRSVRSQFSPFVCESMDVWHALQNNSCPKSPQKGETKRNFNQLKHKAFSASPTHAREV